MKKKLLLFITFAVAHTAVVHSQDTTWFSKEFKKVSGREMANAYSVVFKDKTDTNKVKQLSYTITDTLQMERNFYPYFPKPLLNGYYRVFIQGELREERFYRNDSLHGHYKVYRKNGLLRRDDVYQRNQFISGKCYGITGADTPWFEPEIPAKFPGGMDSLRRYIFKNIRYPYNAKKGSREGRVVVAFTIAKDGSITDVAVKNTVDPDLDTEAVRLVSNMPKWIPGTIEGEPVKFTFRLPVLFHLNE